MFFVGAGFSVPLGYPSGGLLTKRLIEYLGGQAGPSIKNSLASYAPEEKRSELLRTIQSFLRYFFNTTLEGVSTVDVGEFYTLAHSLADMPTLFPFPPKERTAISTLFQDLAIVTRTYFYDIFKAFTMPPDSARLLESLDPNADAIVSLNWDEELDIFLCDQDFLDREVAYTLRSWSNATHREPTYLLLKPHGSVGWYTNTQNLGNKNLYLVAERDDRIPNRSLVAYEHPELPRDLANRRRWTGLEYPPVITAPTFAKRFQYPEQLQIWRDVLEICAGAREFVFLGYSLPPDDYLTRAAVISAQRRSHGVKCVVVTQGVGDSLLRSLRSAFGAELDGRNFLGWSFGSGDESLPDALDDQLRRSPVLLRDSDDRRWGKADRERRLRR